MLGRPVGGERRPPEIRRIGPTKHRLYPARNRRDTTRFARSSYTSTLQLSLAMRRHTLTSLALLLLLGGTGLALTLRPAPPEEFTGYAVADTVTREFVRDSNHVRVYTTFVAAQAAALRHGGNAVAFQCTIGVVD